MTFLPFRARRRRGNAMIEFAIATSLLIPALSGAYQFGYTLYQYDLLSSAVANGARYASSRTYRTLSGAGDLTKVRLATQNIVVYGSPSGGSTPQVRGLTTGNVIVTYTTTSTGIPLSVKVSITNFTVNGIFKSYTFNSKPAITFPFTGRYAPEEAEN
ncbi:MAG: pilus assembly protein [Acidobacteriia bacterium]|nr:pilus assembly protein [Terriglobia bacterium]